MKIVTGLLLALCALGAVAATGDPNRGRAAFESTCTGCHALDRAKVGPPLRDVYGRRAAKSTEFSYSDALKAASIIWDEATLDRWLTDTERVVPGNEMSFRLDDDARRADIIAYLKQLSGSQALPAPAP